MTNDENLFDKYGGTPTIKLVLRAFYKEVLKRHYFKSFFKNTDMDKLILHQIEFISFAMGKPLTDYPDDYLKRGHAGLGITDKQFDEIVQILENILINFQVNQKDIQIIKDAINRKRHLIVFDKFLARAIQDSNNIYKLCEVPFLNQLQDQSIPFHQLFQRKLLGLHQDQVKELH